MNSQGDAHAAVGQSAEHACSKTHSATEPRALGGRRSRGPLRSEGVEHLGCQYPRQRVNGPHAQVDLAGDDHEGHAHGHDGEEARVLGQLGEVLGVEELVHPFLGGGAVSIGVLGEDSSALPVGSAFKEGAIDRSTEDGQQYSQDEDHNE